jgi:transcription antitermination factor NusG
LFPCYVFLRGDLSRRLDIISIPGVHFLVSIAGKPTQIPAAEIDGLRQVLGSGARVEPHPYLKCGDWARVTCGPLAGTQGILVRKKNAYRLVLSIEMLGKAAAVELDAVLVKRLNGKPFMAHDTAVRGNLCSESTSVAGSV